MGAVPLGCCTADNSLVDELLQGQAFDKKDATRSSGRCPLRLPAAKELAAPAIVSVDEADSLKIEFLTDVEGNWEYFLRWVSLSETLYWSDEDRGPFGPGRLLLREGCAFVFGGDAPDKGPGDIRFVRTLLDLKARYVSRVFIVLGNRDLNKLRFSAELVPGAEPFMPPWDKKALRLEDWLAEQPVKSEGTVSILKWMLHFMGCQHTTFNTRRHELATLNPSAMVTEEDVVESFRGSVDPAGDDPWMLRLLQAGKLVVVLGDNLFTHSAFHEAVLGQLPLQGKVDVRLLDWAEDLNAWKDAELQDYAARPFWQLTPEKKGRTRGGEMLMLYGTPGFPGNATVVYNNPFVDGSPRLATWAVEHYLTNNGIRRSFSGHQPHGQTPVVMQHPDSGLLQVMCDTSYSCPSADKLCNPANSRGIAVSVVRIQGETLQVQGVLADGAAHGFTLSRQPSLDELPDALVGRQLVGGSWVKTVLGPDADGMRTHVQAVLANGFSLQTEDMHYGKACLKLKREFAVTRLATPLHSVHPKWLRPSSPGMQALEEATPLETDNQSETAMFNFNEEEFYSAETYIFNIDGVVRDVMYSRGEEEVSSRLSPPGSPHRRSMGEGGQRRRLSTRHLAAVTELEKRVIGKINMLIKRNKRVIFMSNSSCNSRKTAAKKLAAKGINLPAGNFFKHMLNTSFTSAWFLKNAGLSKPFIVCSDTGILEELKNLGMKQYVATIHEDGTAKQEYLAPATSQNVMGLVSKAPDIDCVVLGWDAQLTTLKIAVAAAYLSWVCRSEPGLLGSFDNSEVDGRIPLVACSSDMIGYLGTTPESFMVDRRFANQRVRSMGNGLMAKIICDTVGKDQQFFDVGQPSELMLEALMRPLSEAGLGVDPNEAILIGDSLTMDIAMANRGGIRSLLVFSGETSRSDVFGQDNLPPEHTPTWVLDSFADA